MEPLNATDPQQVGSYLLLGRLGAGGMGQVYLGRSRGGRLVAVKMVHSSLGDDPHFRTRFRREVDAARRISGAFTAPVVDADPDAVPPWLATLFLEGPTLTQVVTRRGPLPVPEVRRIAAGLAEAMEAVHEAGLVHRDLKPSNIILDDKGYPWVIDFGVARSSEETVLTMEDSRVGTAPYMSPEQVEGHPLTYSSDMFGLGGVLAYAATGRPPFGTNIPGVLYRIVHEEPDLTGLSPQLRPLVIPCLDKRPDRRPDPGRLLDLIGSTTGGHDALPSLPPRPPVPEDPGHSGGGPEREAGMAPIHGIGAVDTGRPESFRPDARRRRRLLGTVAVLLAGIAVAGGLLLFGTPERSRSTSGIVGPAPTGRPPGLDLSGSVSIANARAAGMLRIGVKDDQPLLGYRDASGRFSGFDVEVAKMIAADLGFSPEQVTFQPVQSQNRETEILRGSVHFVVASYTITPERQAQVGFAGPYYTAGQSLLVRAGNRAVQGIEDLNAASTVCSVRGSTALMWIEEHRKDVKRVERATYSECVDDLEAGKVTAVSTDDAVLAGYVVAEPGRLRLAGTPFTAEPYGVGLRKEDTVLQAAINASLQRHADNGDWVRAYAATLGTAGLPAAQPPIIPAGG